MQGGGQITVLFAERTVRKRLKTAGLVRELFRRQFLEDGNDNGSDTNSLHRAALEPLLLALLHQIR